MKKFLITTIGFFLLVACTNSKAVTVGGESDDDILEVIEVRQVMPEGGLVDPQHGKERWFAYGAITGVGGVNANGVAQASRFADRAVIHTMQLNLERAPEGFFYEGWLIKGSDVISSGHLQNHFGDARHQLRFESDQDLRGHLKVVVTLEPDDGDPAPADHVAEGMMKVTSR